MTNPADDKLVNTDVTIIGAGIIGICCAIYLQEQGNSVRVIDRLPPGKACSYGNAGVLSSWSCIPDSMPGMLKSAPKWLLDPDGPLKIRWSHLPQCLPWIMKFIRAGKAEQLQWISDGMFALNNPTKDLYLELTKRAGCQSLIVSSSYIHLFKTEAEVSLNENVWEMRRRKGAKIELISGNEVREIEPAISSDYQSAVIISPQGHTTNPERLVKVLAEYFQKIGGCILISEVLDIKPKELGPTRVITTNGEALADNLVISAGAWSPKFAAKLGCQIPIQPQNGYHMTFAAPSVELKNTIMESKCKVVMTSMETGLRIAGMAEFAGLNADPNPRYSQTLTRIAKQVLPDIDMSRGSEWMGHRPCSPDTLPVIGNAPGFSNIFFAFGHGHHGLSGAPMTGRVIAALISGNTSPIDVNYYRPDRFNALM